MARVTAEVVDGKVRYDGRTLADWVPSIAAGLAEACDLREIILFGSSLAATTVRTPTSTCW